MVLNDLPNIGPVTLHRLLETFGPDPRAILAADKRRLEAVRGALLAADPGRSTVADVAMRFGFWELGRFAGAYRARFGELPSATLRRWPH